MEEKGGNSGVRLWGECKFKYRKPAQAPCKERAMMREIKKKKLHSPEFKAKERKNRTTPDKRKPRKQGAIGVNGLYRTIMGTHAQVPSDFCPCTHSLSRFFLIITLPENMMLFIVLKKVIGWNYHMRPWTTGGYGYNKFPSSRVKDRRPIN